MDSEYRFATMDRRDFLRLGGAGLAGAALLGTADGKVLARTAYSLKEQFETAARKYKVPVELLLAMGYYNALWEMPPPSASAYRKGDPEGRGDYGIMQLTQNPSTNTLGNAARLTGLSDYRLKGDRLANIEGGAAILSDLAGKTKPKSLDGWQEPLSRYANADLYASHVYSVLKSGASLTISTGERMELSPQDVEVPQFYTAQSGASDYPRAAMASGGLVQLHQLKPGGLTRHTQDRHPRRTRLLLRHHRLVQELCGRGVSSLRGRHERRGGAVRARRGHRLARRLVENKQAQHRHRACGIRKQPGLVYPADVPRLGEALGEVLQEVQDPYGPQAHNRPLSSTRLSQLRRWGQLPYRSGPLLELEEVHATRPLLSESSLAIGGLPDRFHRRTRRPTETCRPA